MSIKKLDKYKSIDYKINGIKKDLDKVEQEMVSVIKYALDASSNLDLLYEVRSYIDDLILEISEKG